MAENPVLVKIFVPFGHHHALNRYLHQALETILSLRVLA